MGILLSFWIPLQSGEAAVAISPPSITIAQGLQTTRSIIYTITGSNCASVVSNNGLFISGQTVLGVVNSAISTSLTNGSGTVAETLIIPIRVIKQAEQLGVNRFEFRRQFDSFLLSRSCGTFNSSVQINLTSEAAADFQITRLQLYFENGRAEVTVKRNQPALKAYAEIRFTGSGFLRGYWEVDGRILSYVNTNLVYGRNVTIETPEAPLIPTFVTGTHILKFIITSPSGEVPMPEAIYFVTAEEFRTIFSLLLTSPTDRSMIDYSPPTFRWEGRDETVTYLLEFLEEIDGKPIFSAYAKKSDYSLPPSVLKSLFSPGKTYLWRVKGFDAENNVAGESSLFRFAFRGLSSSLPR